VKLSRSRNAARYHLCRGQVLPAVRIPQGGLVYKQKPKRVLRPAAEESVRNVLGEAPPAKVAGSPPMPSV